MRNSALTAVLSLLIAQSSLAAPVDYIGGPVGTVQTIHHCGYLPTTERLYTSSAATTHVVETRLAGLGYRTRMNGIYDKTDKRAVKQFQRDYGLKADGVVGPNTAQRLAFITHPSAHVRSCEGLARG